MATEKPIRLDALSLHECGIVLDVHAPDDELERLMSMGVCEGRTVELIMRGDPLILKVYGSRVGVSARLAERVTVQPCTPETC